MSEKRMLDKSLKELVDSGMELNLDLDMQKESFDGKETNRLSLIKLGHSHKFDRFYYGTTKDGQDIFMRLNIWATPTKDIRETGKPVGSLII